MFKRNIVAILAATLATTAFATKYEAESATLSGGATPGADNSASGSKFVNMNGGTITFPNVSVENAGKYELAITYRADNPKNNLIKVNGSLHKPWRSPQPQAGARRSPSSPSKRETIPSPSTKTGAGSAWTTSILRPTHPHPSASPPSR